MTRAELIQAIRGHSPADEMEADSRDRIIAFLESPGDLFDRKRFAPGHLTGSAFILDAGRENLLLVHHAKLDRWLQPGGHGEPGETDPYAVAAREAFEETGIAGLTSCAIDRKTAFDPSPLTPHPFDLDVHTIPTRKDEPAHWHLDIRYLFVAPAGARPAASAESKGIAWRPLAELRGLGIDTSVSRAARKIAVFI